jgi:putative DNA methylase
MSDTPSQVRPSAPAATNLFGVELTPTDGDKGKKPKKQAGNAASMSNGGLDSGLPANLGKPLVVEVPDFSDPNRPKTCLEVDFPLVPINALSALEGNAGKPIYQMSKWWARRRSCVFRALLLAAAMKAPTRKHPDGQPMLGVDGQPIIDEDSVDRAVWDAYYANHQAAENFKHLKVLDPFMGGGTTLVEGSRLGFQVAGVDLNPVAWFIVKNELACTNPAEVKAFFDSVEAEVKPQIQPFYVTDGVGGKKGRWFKVAPATASDAAPTETAMPEGFDPATLAPADRKGYRYAGPEIIYTFWAKHGPCPKPGCNHRTPIFRSPIVASKKLGVKYIPCTCKNKACGITFHAELGDARVAPDAEQVVLGTEHPYSVLSPYFASRLLSYMDGDKGDKMSRIHELSERVEAEPGLKCPKCGTWSGQTVRDVLTMHRRASRMSDIDKKHLGIVPARNAKKPVYCTLLIDPEWLKGSEGVDGDDELGGYIDAPVEATKAWYLQRLKHLKLIEVRGNVNDAAEDDADEATENAEAVEDGGDEASEKSWLPPTITLKSGRTVDTGIGTVPKRSAFACGSCGLRSDLLDSVKGYTDRARMESKNAAAQRSLPVAVYCFQCHDPAREAEGHPYGGRYFKAADAADIDRLIAAEREWNGRKEADLAAFWPRSALPYTWMTHHLNGGIPNWGFTHWYKFFHPRQLLVHAQVFAAIRTLPGASDDVRAQAVGGAAQTLNFINMFVSYNIQRDHNNQLFAANHFHPKSTTVDVAPFSVMGNGNLASASQNVYEGLVWAQQPWEVSPPDTRGVNSEPRLAMEDAVLPNATVRRGSSTEMPEEWKDSFHCVITDPPFGDNVFYGDLSNFFYVWLRLSLKDRYPAEFGPEFVPRSQEAVADRSRFPGTDGTDDDETAMSAANTAYQGLMTACWAECRRVMKDGGVMAFTFHHSADEPWMSILQSLFDSGWLLEATYPIRSDETKGEGGQFGSRKIEYDIIHVCRKRLEDPKPVSWPKMRQWVKAELSRLRPLLESYKNRGLQDADVRVILRGKALEFFSRHYGQVLVSAPGGEGTPLSIRDALLGINQLLDESSGQPGERPPSLAQPVVYQFLRLFGAKSTLGRDEVSKLLRGTAVQQRDFAQYGWVSEEEKVVRRVPVYERFQKMRLRSRRELKTELDQAQFLIGAALPPKAGDTGVNIEKELERDTFLIRPGVEALLDWYSKTPASADEPGAPAAAGIALQLLRAAFEAKRARMRQDDPMLFEEWESAAASE